MRGIAAVFVLAGCMEDANDRCGDGRLDPGEECDDANDKVLDGCFACRKDADAFCGDGLEQTSLGEACDPKPPNLAACHADCTLPACGDGVPVAGDVCFTSSSVLLAAELRYPTMELADLDGDSRLDILMTRGGASSALEVAFNDGGGAFTRVAITLDLDGAGYVPLAIGDLDADGRLDLAIIDRDLRVIRNKGSRVLAVEAPIELTDDYPSDVAIGDVDGDGDADVVTAHPAAGSLVVIAGGGPLPFGDTQYATEVAVREVELGDFDGDSDPDIVALADESLAIVFVTPGIPTPTFRTHTVASGGRKQDGLIVQRIDSDDRLDLLFDDQGITHVLVAGADRVTFERSAIPAVTDAALADVDGDGNPDLIEIDGLLSCGDGPLCSTAGLATAMLLGHGDGTFGPSDPYLVSYSADGAACSILCPTWSADLEAGDIDGDGATDLVGVAHRGALLASCESIAEPREIQNQIAGIESTLQTLR